MSCEISQPHCVLMQFKLDFRAVDYTVILIIFYVIFVIFLLIFVKQNYTLRYRVSDGVYYNTTRVFISVTPSNMYPPEFTKTEYSVTGITEKDQSAVGRAIATASPDVYFCL